MAWKINFERHWVYMSTLVTTQLLKLQHYLTMKFCQRPVNSQNKQHSIPTRHHVGLMADKMFKDTDELKLVISREPHTLFLLWQLLRFWEYLTDHDQWQEHRVFLEAAFVDWPDMKNLVDQRDKRDVCSFRALQTTYGCAGQVNSTPSDSEKRETETPYDHIYVTQLQETSEQVKRDTVKNIETEIINYFTKLQNSIKLNSRYADMLKIFPSISNTTDYGSEWWTFCATNYTCRNMKCFWSVNAIMAACENFHTQSTMVKESTLDEVFENCITFSRKFGVNYTRMYAKHLSQVINETAFKKIEMAVQKLMNVKCVSADGQRRNSDSCDPINLVLQTHVKYMYQKEELVLLYLDGYIYLRNITCRAVFEKKSALTKEFSDGLIVLLWVYRKRFTV